MHWIDVVIMVAYFLGVLGIGYYFLRTNVDEEDYYVGGRGMGSFQVGFSTVATDVGGGFSIGLGGLGFMIGLSGSWMLFSGLLGAWLSAVVLIPKIKRLSQVEKFYTLPDVFGYYYSSKVALVAALISAIGYAGFTSSQMLAGAKLTTASFEVLDNQNIALLVIGTIIIFYTAMGGIKAVIYTDVIQWIILLSGLIFIGMPIGYHYVGGWEAIVKHTPSGFLTLSNVTWQTFVNWMVKIVPIWFIAMTLYQRIYACRDTKEARRAWFIAGILEWPFMAVMGVGLGLLAHVAAAQGMFAHLGYPDIASMDVEMGLPLLIRTAFPVGLLGLLLAAYFSAIMSTADSCVVVSSGNVLSDIVVKYTGLHYGQKNFIYISQGITLLIGTSALFLALFMENVLSLMLYSYGFLVSGLLIPLVGALFWKKGTSIGAFWAMIGGGFVSAFLSWHKIGIERTLDKSQMLERINQLQKYFPQLKEFDWQNMHRFQIVEKIDALQLIDLSQWSYYFMLPAKLDPNIFGIGIAIIIFVGLSLMTNERV